MAQKIFCGKCRREVDRETFNFWQGTAWCSHCQEVVSGSMSKVPCWVIAVVLMLCIQLSIYH